MLYFTGHVWTLSYDIIVIQCRLCIGYLNNCLKLHDGKNFEFRHGISVSNKNTISVIQF